MLHWWSHFRSRFDLVSTRETTIWNNHVIFRVNGKPLFYNNYNSTNSDIDSMFVLEASHLGQNICIYMYRLKENPFQIVICKETGFVTAKKIVKSSVGIAV